VAKVFALTLSETKALWFKPSLTFALLFAVLC